MNCLWKKYCPIIILIAAPAIIAVSTLIAQGRISVESKVDRSTILIGDVIKYSVIIRHDENVQLESPTLGANLGMFEIRDYQILEPREDQGQIFEQIDYLLSTFDTGEYEIPELVLQYKTDSDTLLHSLKTEPIKITVQSLNPDEAGDIRDIKPPLEPPKNYWRYLYIGLALLLAGGAIAFLIYYLKRRREGKSIIPARYKPPRPAHEIALEALEKLIAGDLLRQGHVKQYYIEISDIVRRYVQDRYFINAPEMTTGQLVEVMGSEHLDGQHIDMMHNFLQQCDLVKFAKYIPENDEIEKTTRLAFDFIQQTKFVIEETTVPDTLETAGQPSPEMQTTEDVH